MSEIHQYFVDQARAALARAQGDPDLAGPLAEWARDAKAAGDSRRGVIVAADGEILAETAYIPGSGASYVQSTTLPEAQGVLGVVHLEVGLAMGTLARLAGQPVIHVTYSDVCTGAGRYV